MIWTYRVFRDNQGRYSIREVFYNRDNKIVNYSKAPVVIVGASFQELMQLVQWFREAFDLPVLSLEEVDNEIATQPENQKSDHSKNISLRQVIAELSTDVDAVS
ncbi:hypothetical protein DSM106972_059830 [Dulcicalothrix desertica PCC 7102]|uniref:Uncharacterized protein n=1 Tax=Dulcicalothrix desertica PCC 7102 TaxID=232991 RepID=A0A3S1AJR8_9CYAN|nr:hypothetical protein [Dulcicalothrix desertica]RUT02505.1 hypothetical protein DSM106972_059830 [Dulcicalothrix desertica PCC 7102]TWH55277.1 hypothetical protein CAL7102_03400 [Dulcicalothrix desertica PCC 7102]